MIFIYFSTENAKVKNSSGYLIECIEDYCSVSQTELHESVQITKDVNGKPHVSIDGIYVSISHVCEIITCVVAPTPIGIDIESKCKHIREPLNSRLYSLKNCDETVIEYWTKIESLSKLTGCGLSSGINYLSKLISSGNFVFEKVSLLPEYICSVCKCSSARESAIVRLR